ncbi:hypothetical protein M422DRAFT_189832 [Sphaerobolus stellatus SS14]|uniref:Uncharacterized protein n=1 Tax=Sphaerobolus stellatus (strain SS14) TaxID=990650 RepID=A0A0C9UHE4_SPHS4|nr:hypothetical protein M422DRAFT_189832 [Sphaerobolus stellatus SS14]
MSNFDNFYGISNFAGVSETVVTDKTVVCESQSVEIVQQYLAVIREYYKRIITQQICQVEVQTVVHDQFFSGCSSFFDDIRHISSRSVTFDHSISTQISSIHDSDGQCLTNDLGFTGSDIGRHSASIQGISWNDATDSISVNQAYGQVQMAHSYGYGYSVIYFAWPSYTRVLIQLNSVPVRLLLRRFLRMRLMRRVFQLCPAATATHGLLRLLRLL